LKLKQFLGLLQAATPEHVFNPWAMRDEGMDLAADAARLRTQRLAAHLAVEARYVLVGEAAGYQGCKVSGIPFTSERLLLAGVIPRIATPAGRLTSRLRPWSEPSATTVWKTLHALGIAGQTVLWNAYPWHPHRPGVVLSNRTPTRTERMAGVPVLHAYLSLFPAARVFAVGRNAEISLAELGIGCTPLRHPSMGGAREFARQLKAGVRGG
jgi:uracil-DNA glycosylase